MAELPSTQANNLPPIFRQENGDPLRLFVEACSILNRPKLVRTLKKAGAEICIDPRQAQIILVDPRTDDGRKFIRDWSGDMDKVVLDHSWVAKSLAAGRALGEVDQWGGCLTQDDGLPLDADAGFDDEPEQEEQPKNKSPLPTPRVTPVETTIAKGKGPRRSQAAANVSESSSSSPNAGAQNDANHASTIPTTSTAESPALMTPESLIFQNASSSSAQTNNGFPATTGADTHFPTTPASQYDFPGVQQFQHNPAPFVDFVQQTMQPGMTQPVNFMQPVTQQPGMIPSMQLWQMMGSMFSQSAAQLNSDRFAMSLMDAMRNYGVVPYPQAATPVPGSQQPPVSMPRSPSPRLSPSISRNARDSISGFPPQVGRRSGRRPKSPAPPAFSTPQPKKQKRGEKSPHNRRQTIASVGPSRPLYTAESPTKKQKLFVKGNEQPISFFVQIDQPHRLNLVTLIKKNGGKIDSSQTTADYAILYSQSKTFNDLLKSAMEAGKTAVSAPFIHDSVEAGAMLDSEKYKLKLLKKSKKRGAQGDSSSDVEELTPAEAAAAAAAEQQRFARSQRKPKKRAKAEGSNAGANVVEQEGEPAFGRPRIPSPIPPSPESEQFSLRGRAKYSDLEREYALKYIQVLLERDRLMSTNALGNHLYRKLPHHSLKSWVGYISNYNMREEVDMIRKKAGIAYRKVLSDQKKPQVVKEEPQDLDLDELRFDNPSQKDMEVDSRRDEEEDLNIICDFFAYGGGDEQDEGTDQEQLWRRLASKATCKTAPSWVEFYDQHYVVIQERYSKLVDAQPTEPLDLENQT